MKTDKEWEARAIALWNERSGESHEEAMVRFGREMADARAEEIAYRLDVLAYTAAAQIARSTIRSAQGAGGRAEGPPDAEGARITKPKEPPGPVVVEFTPQTVAAIRADEREKIANFLDSEGKDYGAALIREFFQKPKTREQVLEVALREIAGQDDGRDALQPEYSRSVARRALEWRP